MTTGLFLAMTIVVFLVVVPSPSSAQLSKIDPFIKIFAREVRTTPGGLASKAISLNEEGIKVIDCFVQVYNPDKAGAVAETIKSLGGSVRTTIDAIMTATIPLDAVEEIAALKEVKYIEAGKPLSHKNDVVRVTVGSDSVNAGTGLDKRYDGSGVIVGVVDDTAFDWGHADFLDTFGKVRTLFFWDKSKSGSGVKEISGSGGIECTKTQMNAGTCTATSGGDSTSHSTHVGGTAAGSDATYTGSAPGADIIAVYNVETDANSGGNLATTIVDDVKYIFAKASSLKEAAVVNLSLGTSLGAHDGTSLMETSLDNLVNDVPGRAIVNAEGNENFSTVDSGAATYAGIHATVNQTSVDRAFDYAVRRGDILRSSGLQTIADIWLTKTSSCTIEIDGFDFAKTTLLIDMGAVSSGSSKTATNSGSTVSITLDFTDVPNANNGKSHAVGTITFASSLTNAQIQNFSFDLIFRGTCTGDAWLWPDRTDTNDFTKRFGGTTQGQAYTYVDGDSLKTTTIPATAKHLIAAGSFMDRATWVDSSGVTHYQTATSGTDYSALGATGGTLNAISLFSSLGPTADGRTKPDVTSPGEAVVSSLSANNAQPAGVKVNSNHFKDQGTSMSAPVVTGIAALMLQRNHCLTVDQIKNLLTGNATTDSFTGTSLPNNTWGYGKVSALASMKGVTAYAGTCGTSDSSGAQTTPVTTTSGNAGGGGCSLVIATKQSPDSHLDFFAEFTPSEAWGLAMTIAAIAGLTIRRRFTNSLNNAAESSRKSLEIR